MTVVLTNTGYDTCRPVNKQPTLPWGLAVSVFGSPSPRRVCTEDGSRKLLRNVGEGREVKSVRH